MDRTFCHTMSDIPSYLRSQLRSSLLPLLSMNYRQFSIAASCLSLCSFVIGPTAALALGIQVVIDGKTVTFMDVPQSAWYATYVRQSAEVGIVSGYEDEQGESTGLYGPSNRITIAEALKIAVEGAGYDAEAYGRLVASGYSNHWASKYVSVAKAENFTIAQTSRIQLDRPATRAEVAAMFTSAFRVNVDDVTASDSRYTDVKSNTEGAASIEALSRDEVVTGDTDDEGQDAGTFRPLDAINRAEVAKIVIRAREEYQMPGEGRSPETSGSSSSQVGINVHLVTYTDSGFSPSVIHVKKGDTVQFKNESTSGLWVASDPHPTHTDLPAFDADKNYLQGEIYSYTFTQFGTWTFHNHLKSSAKGTVVVE